MSRNCGICANPNRATIDAELLAGTTARRVASDYGLSYDATARHARNHAAAPRPSVPPPPDDADALDELTAALRLRALAGSDSATREYRLSLTAQAARAAAPVTFDVLRDPAWLRLRTILLDAYADDPAGQARLADAIRRGEST